ncbi:Ldh family oxidoreductase [Hwanghaeella sp.]|uniref:Ldh family oxidoreductase n=1 Tax=Hwanghaeella sp. TaxID=2605943 RepID=UPI003CCC1A25
MGTEDGARYDAGAMEEFGVALFSEAGMPQDRAEIVSKYLLEADLMGHDTHGFNQAPRYLRHTMSGEMPPTGDPQVLHDKGPCLTWDGNYMSGVWLTYEAVREAVARAKQFGIGAVSIRRSHHIACLAAFLQLATDEGLVIQLLSSDPAASGVAPFGAVEQVFTPNPMAYGIPTGEEAGGDPILVDISASITTLGMSYRMIGLGQPMSGQWFIDNKGNPSNDPAVLKDDPPGALLTLGGMDAGHKGFGLALMVEAMTSGIGGFGRADGATNTGASVFVQVTDPDAFGGREAFLREVSHTANACRKARVPDGKPPVRLPGDGALARKRAALADGVRLYPGILPQLEPIAKELGVAMPKPI